MKKIAVIGLGKAGLPLAAVIADAGIGCIGVDIDAKRVEMLNKGENPIPEEDGLGDILKEHAGGNFIATTDYELAAKECDTFIVIVPLFINDNKEAEFDILEHSFRQLSKNAKSGDLFVLETTVPPGTTEGFIKDILEESGLKVGTDILLAYSPERIMTGQSISRYKEFPKVVGGTDVKSNDRVYEVYSQFCQNVEKVSNARTAEMVKVSEGVYRDINIAIANELYKISERIGVDFYEMKKAAAHAFCNIHDPGNVGGHCIPVYPWFLINDGENDTRLMKVARDINDGMVDYYSKKIKDIAPSGKVAVLGLSYREGVKELAYTRSIPMIHHLKSMGYEVFAHDPMYDDEEVAEHFFAEPLALENLEEMDAVIIMNKEEMYIGHLKDMKERVIDVKKVLG